MGRKNDSTDTVERTRIVGTGVWQSLFADQPDGKGDISLRNLPYHVLAGLEADGEANNKSVQDMIRHHLKSLYPPKNK